ncbi:hypothetical protein ACOSQ2_004374 [Xanthoceras sorbifolium]
MAAGQGLDGNPPSNPPYLFSEGNECTGILPTSFGKGKTNGAVSDKQQGHLALTEGHNTDSSLFSKLQELRWNIAATGEDNDQIDAERRESKQQERAAAETQKDTARDESRGVGLDSGPAGVET